MKRLISSFVLGMAVVCFSSTVHAQQGAWIEVVVDFEEYADALNADAAKNGSNNGWAWNGTSDRFYSGLFPSGMLTPTGKESLFFGYMTLPQYSHTNKDGVTFGYAGWDGQAMNFWAGTGVSAVSGNDFAGFMNEMAVAPGGGAGGSQTYGVVYGDCLNNLLHDSYGLATWITLPEDSIIKSFTVTNTVYTAQSLGAGLDGSGGWSVPSPAISSPGEAFGINIYGVGAEGNLISSLKVELGGWRDDAAWVLTDWLTVEFGDDFLGTSELRFSFFTTIIGDDSSWGFFTPAYFAYDDLTFLYWDPNAAAVPEPATLAVLGLGLAGLAVARRRRK